MSKQGDWRSETAEDRAEYQRWLRRKINKAPHSMTCRVLNWNYCSRCGLMALKNEATRKALQQGCEK